MENLIKKFFNRETKQQDWGENIFVEKPKLTTIKADEKVGYNETFQYINKELIKIKYGSLERN